MRPLETNCPQVESGWLVGCFGLNGPLRQYFSPCRTVSQREEERKRNDRREKKCPMGWSGGAKVLGKLPGPGRPTIVVLLSYVHGKLLRSCRDGQLT